MTDTGTIDVALLTRYLDEPALTLLDRYFNSGDFTGGRFERLAGGGDRVDVADRFTSDDIVAVSLLGIRIPGRTALAILDWNAPDLTALLKDVPVGMDLWAVPETTIGPGSAADRLWHRLVELPGAGWVTAGKLLARKRPQLIPVYDRVVKTAMQRTDSEWWRPLRAVLHGHPEVIDKLAGLRERTGLVDEVSLLRILDVCVWMSEYGQPEPIPDADT